MSGHVMVDLETWGRRYGCAIRSIGACVFDPVTGDLGSRFYQNIDDASCHALGLHEDPETVSWWGDQSPEAQAALWENQIPLGDALLSFTKWFKAQGCQFIYGHGATFDITILEAAYHALSLDPPWNFWHVRCSRTILAMANRRPDRRSSDVRHNALNDAEAQARAVAAAFRYGQFSPR